ncbi:MAG: hypothetical protein ACLU0O_03750 [Collinsella sp.]
MADCATIEDIRRAVDMGFDLVSTTLLTVSPPSTAPWPMALICRSCVRRPRNSRSSHHLRGPRAHAEEARAAMMRAPGQLS